MSARWIATALGGPPPREGESVTRHDRPASAGRV